MTSGIPATSGIYRIRNLINEKCYIGSSCNLYVRWQEHQRDLRHDEHHNQKLQRAWAKYTESAFVFEIIELVLPPFLLEREQYWLDREKPFKKGYNIARSAHAPSRGLPAHNRGKPPSAETRQKLSEAGKGKKVSPETREKIRLATLGHTVSPEVRERLSTSLKGKPISAEARQKMSQTRKGRQLSPEHRHSLSLSKTGTRHTDETKRKLSDASKGRVHSPEAIEKIRLVHLGKQKSAEVRANMSAGNSAYMKTLIVTAPDGTVYTVTGIANFCREQGLHHSSLTQVAKGKRLHTQGWTARYLDPDPS